MVLHIVNKSPFERNSLQSCLKTLAAESSILMIEDGVYGALAGSRFEGDIKAVMDRAKVYALEPDLAARGVADRLIDGITTVDYAGFVDLVEKHTVTQSWL